ncbi:MAG TPA: GDP-fucose synthetase [Elusimicrobia bacterium]|nr:GDP-fucose synthetase [Elusimicrobiota bacterium]
MSYWDGRKVLVTGGAGFTGSHLVEQLLERGRGVKVTVADDLSSGSLENLRAVKGRVRFLKADLRKPEACAKACRSQQAVLHLAARMGGVAFNSAHPATMFRENTLLTLHVLEAARVAKVERFLMTSSACVYPRFCTVPTPETEGFKDWPEPTNEGYGWAKRMDEFQAMAYRKEFGLKVAIARPYNTYGPRDDFDPKTSHVIPALIRRVLSGENPLRVWGTGKQSRSFLYVDDAARGLLDAAERYAVCDPVNLGTREEVTIAELVKLIVELGGKSPKLVFDPSKPSGQPRRNCDTRKALRKLGFKAQVSLREGLSKTIAWYRETR